MSDSQKFPVAAHALAYLAHKGAFSAAEAVSSAALAATGNFWLSDMLTKGRRARPFMEATAPLNGVEKGCTPPAALDEGPHGS